MSIFTWKWEINHLSIYLTEVYFILWKWLCFSLFSAYRYVGTYRYVRWLYQGCYRLYSLGHIYNFYWFRNMPGLAWTFAMSDRPGIGCILVHRKRHKTCTDSLHGNLSLLKCLYAIISNNLIRKYMHAFQFRKDNHLMSVINASFFQDHPKQWILI